MVIGFDNVANRLCPNCILHLTHRDEANNIIEKCRASSSSV